MTNNQSNYKREFDLDERTVKFSANLIVVLNKIPKNNVTMIIINQVIRSGTSIGANYHEANEAVTPKDFKNLIRISKKECKETIYWLRLLTLLIPNKKQDAKYLLDEASQLVKIFASIYQNSK